MDPYVTYFSGEAFRGDFGSLRDADVDRVASWFIERYGLESGKDGLLGRYLQESALACMSDVRTRSIEGLIRSIKEGELIYPDDLYFLEGDTIVYPFYSIGRPEIIAGVDTTWSASLGVMVVLPNEPFVPFDIVFSCNVVHNRYVDRSNRYYTGLSLIDKYDVNHRRTIADYSVREWGEDTEWGSDNDIRLHKTFVDTSILIADSGLIGGYDIVRSRERSTIGKIMRIFNLR